MLLNAVKLLDFFNLLIDGGDIRWLLALNGGDHGVLLRVLGRDELEDFGRVTATLQQQSAQAICNGFGFTLKQDAMLEQAA